MLLTVTSIPRLVGMVHLGPLPGSPDFSGSLDAVEGAAVVDARILEQAGFDGIMVENFGDVPFFADDVPKLTVAAMTRMLTAVVDAVSLPVGVNVLRNDGTAALAIAAVTGAAYVRINVLSGLMYTDQGPIVGRAAEIARFRRQHAPDVAIMADVFVKHAVPPPGSTIEQAARDLAERGGVDAVVVSGSGTGAAAAREDLMKVRATVDLPVVVGSGATVETVRDLLGRADGVIVGTSIKRDGVSTNPVDLERARAFVAAAGAHTP